jgi:hypothetical protein
MWPQLRAALLAVAIALGVVDGCPYGSPPRPLAWIERITRVSQQWALYQSPSPTRYRMWIEVQGRDGGWQLAYRAGDADHAEDAAVIEHARVWGTWDPTDRPPLEYGTFCAWITARALVAHPDAVAARVRMERIAIGKGEFTPTGAFQWPYVRARGGP